MDEVKSSQLYEIMSRDYSINPDNIVKESNISYLVYIGGGCYRLYKVSHKQSSYVKGVHLQDYLVRQGFSHAAQCIQTNNKHLTVKHGHSMYTLESYIPAHLINVENIDECINSFKTVGEFHLFSSGFYKEGIRVNDNAKSMNYRIREYKNLVITFKSAIKKKKVLTDFDKYYLSMLEELLNRLDICKNLFNSFQFDSLYKATGYRGLICHNRLLKDSLYTCNDGSVLLTSFNSVSAGMPLIELSSYAKKILSNGSYNYSFEHLKCFLEAYSSSKDLSAAEYGCLLGLIITPDMLISIGKKRYLKSKSWREDKYMKKLNKAVMEFNLQKNLIEAYSEFYGIAPALYGIIK